MYITARTNHHQKIEGIKAGRARYRFLTWGLLAMLFLADCATVKEYKVGGRVTVDGVALEGLAMKLSDLKTPHELYQTGYTLTDANGFYFFNYSAEKSEGYIGIARDARGNLCEITNCNRIEWVSFYGIGIGGISFEGEESLDNNFGGYSNKSHEFSIIVPVNRMNYQTSEEIPFLGAGPNPPVPFPNAQSLVWHSSLDGRIGTGQSFTIPAQTLSAGLHTITLVSGTSSIQDSVEITVYEPDKSEEVPDELAPIDPMGWNNFFESSDDILRLQGGAGLTTKGGGKGYELGGGDGARSPLKPGFLAGASVPFQRSPTISIEAGLQVETKGYKETFSYGGDFIEEGGRQTQAKGDNINTMNLAEAASSTGAAAVYFKNTTTLTYLGAPVMAHVTPFPQQPRLGILAGLQSSFLLGRTSKTNDATNKGTDGFKSIDMGLLLGAHYRLPNGFGARLLYEYGLTDVTENEFDTFKNRALKLTVTYDIPMNLFRRR